MESILAFDNGLLLYIQENLRSAFLDGVIPIITALGDYGLIWLLCIGVLLCRKETRQTGLGMLIALALALVIGNFCLKPLVARSRPVIDALVTQPLPGIRPPDTFSFPSGHTGSSVGAAVALWIGNHKWGTAAIVLALLISFSRLYLCVHYPTDVLVSILLGILYGVAGQWLAKKIMEKVQMG